MNATTPNPDPICTTAPTQFELNQKLWGNGKTFPAPKDGTPIAAIGRVIGERAAAWTDDDDDSPPIVTLAEPFLGFVRWEKDSSGFEGWHFINSGMSVAFCIDDEVIIDWWNPLPVEVAPKEAV